VLCPGLCVAVMATSNRLSETAATMMLVLAVGSALFTIAGVMLFLARAVRDFRRH